MLELLELQGLLLLFQLLLLPLQGRQPHLRPTTLAYWRPPSRNRSNSCSLAIELVKRHFRPCLQSAGNLAHNVAAYWPSVTVACRLLLPL